MDETDKKENQAESEIIKALREHYEKIIEDKDKTIKQLIDKPLNVNNNKDNVDEEAEESEKDEQDDEEKRRQKRLAYYKKYIR